MSWSKRHVGDWISIRASARRKPWRVSVGLALGDLPDGWSDRGGHARTWTGLIGLVLIAPFALLLAAGALRALGIGVAYDWISSTPAAIIAATVSLIIGIPVAFAMNLWRIAHLGMRRHRGRLEGLVALEFAPLHLLVVLMALVIGGVFVGHLAADAYAGWNGVSTAC